MKNYRLHMVRHGMTVSNAEGRCAGGRTDCELSNDGIAALLTLREQYEYPGVGLVYCAPLTRCVQTVNVIYPERGVILVEGLKERDLGCFEGEKLEELQRREDFRAWLADAASVTPAGGEPMKEYAMRVLEAAASVINDMIKNEVFDAALVTDGGVMMTILSAIAFPRLPLERWMCGPGRGYTCYVNPQMWTRDRLIEAAGLLPYGIEEPY